MKIVEHIAAKKPDRPKAYEYFHLSNSTIGCAVISRCEGESKEGYTTLNGFIAEEDKHIYPPEEASCDETGCLHCSPFIDCSKHHKKHYVTVYLRLETFTVKEIIHTVFPSVSGLLLD